MDLTAVIEKMLPEPGLPVLRVGDHLIGTVVHLRGDGLADMDFGRFRAVSRLPTDVRPGQRLNLRVQSTGPPIRLRIEAGPDRPVSGAAVEPLGMQWLEKESPMLRALIRRLLAADPGDTDPADQLPPTIQRALRIIEQHFEPLHADWPTDKIARRFRQTAEDNGIFYEKRLTDAVLKMAPEKDGTHALRPSARGLFQTASQHDLKAQLILLQQVLDDTGEPLAYLSADKRKVFRQELGRLLQQIEEYQISSTAFHDRFDATAMVLAYMIPVKDRTAPLKFKVYYPRKTVRGENAPHRVSLLLDLERMGALRADLALHQRHLQVDIFVFHEPVVRLLERRRGELEKLLTGIADSVQVSVRHSETKVNRFDIEDAEAIAAGGIDVNA